MKKSPITFKTKHGNVSFKAKPKRRSPAKSLEQLNRRLMKAFPTAKQSKMRSRAREKWLSAHKK